MTKGAGGDATPQMVLPVALVNGESCYSKLFFYPKIRQYQGVLPKKFDDNNIKCNVTVTSSNFSLNE